MISKTKVKKHISILYLNYSMEIGGIETLIDEFAIRMTDNGIAASIGVFKSGGRLEKYLQSRGIQIYDLKKKEGIDISLILRLRKHLKKEKIKILHTHNYSAWLYGILASLGIKEIKNVHTEHSNVNKKRRAWAEKMLVFFTDLVVCVSEDVRRSMIENQRISQERLKVIYNGVDTDKFSPSLEVRKVCRQQLGIDANTPVVGIVARLCPVKDHENLLKAFAIILKKIPDAVLLIIGDGELKDDLINKAHDLGLNKEVLFLGERHDIPELLNAMDVFILCSLSEGHNMSLIEAMAVSLPVVATHVGGNKEIVLDEVNGYLVPSKDSLSLSNRIMYLIDNRKLRIQMGKEARKRVMDKFSIERMLQAYKDNYLKLHLMDCLK